ncbi:MAG: hypothetical protein N2544_18430, partial [Burkholderiales bacterium]|nr:hypothetical protein [Burkholderiales bacterium]
MSTPDGGRTAVEVSAPTWQRVDPALVWWTPGSTKPGDALIVELMPFLPSDLEAFVGQPGFYDEGIRAVVSRFGQRGWRADGFELGSRGSIDRDVSQPDSGSLAVIEVLALCGRVPGSLLRTFTDLKPADETAGPLESVIAEDKTYFIQTWVVADHVLYFCL